MAGCDSCFRDLVAVGDYLVCPAHGDRTKYVAAASAPAFPTYAVDLRTLVNDSFADARPVSRSYADVMVPKTLRQRVQAYRKWRKRDANHDLIWWEDEALPGSVRLHGEDRVALVSAAEYYRACLAGLLVPLPALLDYGPTHGIPGLADTDGLLESYWTTYAGLTIPEPVMDALLRASVGKGGTYFLNLIESCQEAMLVPVDDLSHAVSRRVDLRAEALRAGMSKRIDPFQVAVVEAFIDILLIARGAMEDVRRAESEARLQRRPVAGVIEKLDGESDLEFERVLPLTVRNVPLSRKFSDDEQKKVAEYLAGRPAYGFKGVFQKLETEAESGERPEAPLTGDLSGFSPPRTAPASSKPSKAGSGSKTGAGKVAETPPVSDSSGITISLAEIGRDLTERALAGDLPRIVGRERELDLTIETLCRRTKRNPVLVGPAGTGKTAIAEGLARRLATDDVPEILRGRRLIELPVSSIMGNSIWVGEMEKHAGALIDEARRTGAILFIDELHTIVGAGSGYRNQNDLAQVFKPALARGDLLVVGATTESEYQHFIEQDDALERRLNPIPIREMTEEATLAVLASVRDELIESRGIRVEDPELRDIYRFARDYMPNRSFPDKAIDLLEHCVAAAVVEERKTLSPAQILEVIQRRVGMPLELEEKLPRLRERLDQRALLTPGVVESLVDRLAFTMRGVDLAPERPNAVMLLTGDAAEQAEHVARTVAEQLYGSRDRLVRLNALVGFPELDPQRTQRPSRAHGLLAVKRDPWTVVLIEGVDGMKPDTAQLLRGLLSTGSITDAQGRRIHISDTVVIATADLGDAGGVPGFARDAEDRSRTAARRILGEPLTAEFDFIVSEVRSPGETVRRTIADDILPRLAERYRERGLALEWDAGMVERLVERAGGANSVRELERVVEEGVGMWSTPITQH